VVKFISENAPKNNKENEAKTGSAQTVCSRPGKDQRAWYAWP
jgi:hypothetical protein